MGPTHRCRFTPPFPKPLPPGPTLPPVVLVPANLPASGALRAPELDGALDFEECDLGGAEDVGCVLNEGNMRLIVDAIGSKTLGLWILR